MEEVPITDAQAKSLRFLRRLVTVLTTTMILGMIALIALFVIRFSAQRPGLDLPAKIELPTGVTARAFTQGQNWYAVVTSDDEILIFDRATQDLFQRIKIKSP